VSKLSQGGAVLGQPHGNGGALPDQLQLESPRTLYREIDRVGIFALAVAELNPRHAVAVDYKVDEWRIGVESLAEHDHGLAVFVSFSEKLGRGRDRKVARHLSPNIVELIRLAPDIRAGAGDPVLPGGGVKLGGPFDGRTAYVVGIREGAQLFGLSESRRSQQANDPQFTHAKIVPRFNLAPDFGVESIMADSIG
jgi:hypothetical protein